MGRRHHGAGEDKDAEAVRLSVLKRFSVEL
jgi:hypothetical protein